MLQEYSTKIFPRTKVLQMTMLQTHMLNINKTSVSKGTLDAILLRLANSAISSHTKKRSQEMLNRTNTQFGNPYRASTT